MSKASFIIPTRNIEKNIGKLLESILSQNYEGELEMLVMDSSEDRTPEIVKNYPVELVRVEPEDYNYGGTRNLGAAMTSGEFLVFLSTDIKIRDKNWLFKLLRHFEDKSVAGVYGRQLPKEDACPMEKFFLHEIYPKESFTIYCDDDKKIKPRNGFFFSNVNSVIRRKVWEKIKIPEMLKSEDWEWAKRALLEGYKIVYDCEATVYHSHNYNLKTVFQEYFDSGAAMPFIYNNGQVNYSMKDFLIDGTKHVFRQFKFFVQNNYTKWIPYATIYDAFKFLGIFLGANQKYIPLKLKRTLCKKKNHWEKYTDIIKEAHT
ncbi:MAG: glycosyltransferase family 2 protein [Candidatus Lokiarchaeia archaeon]